MAGRRRFITMAQRRHTPEQIIRELRETDRLLGEGRTSPRLPSIWRCRSRRITGGGTSITAIALTGLLNPSGRSPRTAVGDRSSRRRYGGRAKGTGRGGGRRD